MDRRSRWGWGLVIATATAVTAFGAAAWQASAAPGPGPAPLVGAEQPTVTDPSPPPEPVSGTGTDPLTKAELDRARAVAVTPELAARARDVTGAAGPEYLSAELAEGAGRTGNLYYYDYRTDHLIKQVVDLGSGRLTASYQAAGLQLPAAAREVSTALDVLLADPLAAELKTAYRTTTGQEFAGTDGLVVTAHVYRPKPADTAARRCGAHRCLQLVVETGDGHFIDVNDIVIDLSGRTVARLA